jgi:hypothetical protein
MTTRALRNLAIFLTAFLFSVPAYAVDGTVQLVAWQLPWRVVVGCLACLLVRIFIWTESKNKLVAYNLTISAIAILGTGVYVFEYPVNLTEAFATGLGVGAGAVGLVEFPRSKLLTSIKDAILASMSKG